MLRLYNSLVRYLLALDEGTTSARAALYDETGVRIALESEPIVSSFPQPGWVEQDAEAIWRAQLSVARRVLQRCRGRVAALGMTNQRETTVIWDRTTGRPVAPAIVWQCRRTADRCRSLAASPYAQEITARSGLVVDAYFSATKIEWLLEHIADGRTRAENGDLLFGTIDSWLLWNLTAGSVHATDFTNASRTMLMNLSSGEWDPWLLDIFGVPSALLPRIVPSSGIAGVCAAEHFGYEIPIASMAGDQQAALAGQVCFSPGLTKNTYGTGCFALMHTGGHLPPAQQGLLATRAASPGAEPQFAIEGSVFVAGAVIQWLRDQLGLLKVAAESEALARSVDDNAGVYFVPAFVGLGAPYWNGHARAAISGLTFGAGRAHIVRAALESIAYQTRELLEAMQQVSRTQISELRVDGGAAANNFLMQFQADILGCRIVRPQDIETTALGAAYLAGLAIGVWSGPEQLQQLWKPERIFEPQMSPTMREELFAGWKQAVARCQL